MATRDIDGTYVNRVMDVMFNKPTAQDIDFLVEAYAKIGYYAAVAESLADEAEATLKMAEADAYIEAKADDPKASVEMVKANVVIRTLEPRGASVRAKASSRKLKTLYESIEQAIHAAKFLSRNEGSVFIGGRRTN